MTIEKVTFLNDLEKTIEFLKNMIMPNDQLIRLEFYTSGKIDDNNIFEKKYNHIDNIDMNQETYDKAKKISLILKNNDLVKTVHCDKNSGLIIVFDNSNKRELNRIVEDIDLSNVDMDDNCTYYKFEFGILGKYDHSNGNYYIYEDDKWKLSGDVMRWVEDPGYICEEIGKNNDIHR